MASMNRDEVFGKVKEVLVDALGVDEDEVTRTAKVMTDLGAESIDILDIVFRLERTFNIKIPRGEMFLPDELLNNPEYVDNGKMTAKGITELKRSMPHADTTEFEKNPEVTRIMTDLFTVDTIVNYVQRKLAA